MPRLEVDTYTIKDFYDNRYQGGYMREHKGLDPHRVKNALDEIPARVKTILDYGCGQGGWIGTLLKKFPQAELYGIDISAKAIALAEKKYPQHNFFVFDGQTAPFADNSFDLIYSYHVLEHVGEIQKTVSDISRLLKKDGYLCIILPCGNKDSFEERITCLVEEGKEASIDAGERFFYDDTGHIRRLKSRELIELFAQHDVRICRELYAYQFWGAVEWISKAGSAVINEIFNSKKGVNFLAKMKLLFLKAIFLMAALAMRLYMANLLAKIKSERSIGKKILLAALLPFKVLIIPFGKLIDLFSFMEWHFLKTAKNGSAQYLIFKK